MLFKGKKAQVNDVTYIITIFGILLIVALALPFIQSGFGADQTDNNIDMIGNLNQSHKNDFEDSLDALGGSPAKDDNIMGQIIESVFKMLFWYYGTLPLVLEAFFIFLKLIGWILVYRLIRSGGG